MQLLRAVVVLKFLRAVVLAKNRSLKRNRTQEVRNDRLLSLSMEYDVAEYDRAFFDMGGRPLSIRLENPEDVAL